MKIIKILILAAALVVVVLASAPLWGGCNINYRLCATWCEIRHMASDVDKLACKASCVADKASCLAR